jgi:hypothetical protein
VIHAIGRVSPKSQEIAMSSTQVRSETAIDTPKPRKADMKLEVVVIPVSDVERAKRFYGGLGWRSELASALRRAEAAHGEHEKRTGQRDAEWANWYAEYIVQEQAGKPLPP